MRKDVTLGMTIGGGVLVVILVGSIALSHKNKNHRGADTTALMNADGSGGAGDTAGQSTDDSTAKPQDGAASSKNTDIKPADPKTTPPPVTTITRADPKRDRITDALMNGGGSEPAVTQTPDTTGGQGNVETPPSSGGDQPGVTKLPDPVTPPGPKSPASPRIAASKPSDSSGSGTMHTHVVQKGETFSTIAAAAYGSANYYPYIMRANPNVDAKQLKPNMVLKMPDISDVKPSEKAETKNDATPAAHKAKPTIDASTEYLVVSGDNLNRISLKLYGKIDMVEKLIEANKATIGANPAALKIGQVLKLPSPPVTPATAASR